MSSFVIIHWVRYEHQNIQQGAVEAQCQRAGGGPKLTGILPSACTSRILLAHSCGWMNLDNAVRVVTRAWTGLLQNIHTASGVHPESTYSVGTNRRSMPVGTAPGSCCWPLIQSCVEVMEGCSYASSLPYDFMAYIETNFCHLCMWVLSLFYEKR
jgi:hypothetical protein